MFEVIHRESNNKYVVYDIQYDGAGYPHFLIYKNDQWLRVSAKHFLPVTDVKVKKGLRKHE